MAATIDLNLVATFVRVMETGSFTGAARAMSLPTSSVSRRVTALEQALRVRLLQRSTRKLVLTEAGRIYFQRARAGLADLHEASNAVTDMGHETAGLIRFTTGPDTTGLMASLLAEFLRRYPKIRLDVLLTPRRVDLLAEGVDLALRAGRLADSSLVARRLGSSDFGLFASRNYLRREGRPANVAELARHAFVVYGGAPDRETLRLDGPRGVETVKVQARLVVDELSFVRDSVAEGVGIGLIPVMFSGPRLRPSRRRRASSQQDVVRILPWYGLDGVELSLVSPPTAYEPARVSLLRNFLIERFGPVLQQCQRALASPNTSAAPERPTRIVAKRRASAG